MGGGGRSEGGCGVHELGWVAWGGGTSLANRARSSSAFALAAAADTCARMWGVQRRVRGTERRARQGGREKRGGGDGTGPGGRREQAV